MGSQSNPCHVLFLELGARTADADTDGMVQHMAAATGLDQPHLSGCEYPLDHCTTTNMFYGIANIHLTSISCPAVNHPQSTTCGVFGGGGLLQWILSPLSGTLHTCFGHALHLLEAASFALAHATVFRTRPEPCNSNSNSAVSIHLLHSMDTTRHSTEQLHVPVCTEGSQLTAHMAHTIPTPSPACAAIHCIDHVSSQPIVPNLNSALPCSTCAKS